VRCVGGGKESRDVIAEINALSGKTIFVTTDVSQAREVKAMVDQTLATFGRLDGALNNAGIGQALTPLPEQTEETYAQIIDIKGVWLSRTHEMPAMLQTGGGAGVNNASGVGLISFPTVPVYVASARRQRWTKPKRLDWIVAPSVAVQ
jgi:NAD(P)-dependent dehydrogenase (short-subunit alcohol dehydrogenase family)